MDYTKDYLPYVKKMVKPKRYNHILGVVNEAIELAQIYGVSVDKARIAASLHDITKYLPDDEQVELITKTLGPDAIDDIPRGGLHAISGAIYARDYLGVDDTDIYNAIYNHTLGRPNMSALEKIIYVSDFTEPSREAITSKTCKDLALNNLDKALLYAMTTVVNFLEESGQYVPKVTYDAIKYYKELLNEQ